MIKAHKATSQAQFLLRRKIAVEGLNENKTGEVIQKLNHYTHVDFAEDKQGGQLVVTFDGRRWSTNELIEFIESHGGRLKHSWWQRKKHAWYRFTDENVRDNAKHVHTCCSKPPAMRK